MRRPLKATHQWRLAEIDDNNQAAFIGAGRTLLARVFPVYTHDALNRRAEIGGPEQSEGPMVTFVTAICYLGRGVSRSILSMHLKQERYIRATQEQRGSMGVSRETVLVQWLRCTGRWVLRAAL